MTSTTTTFRASTTDMTVYAIDANGEAHDLNADGAPCEDVDALLDFIGQLCEQGAFDESTRDSLRECI